VVQQFMEDYNSLVAISSSGVFIIEPTEIEQK
jgi:hypothetical protein